MAVSDEKNAREPNPALMSAITTEHFVMQAAIGTTISEAGSRATIYVMALSSSLVAMGFAANSTLAFLPFVATVLPVIFLLGVLTTLRMVDIAVENMQAHIAIARIRSFYRTLGPQAEAYFAAERGRWPEGRAEPALRIGALAGYLTTAAMMIATVNAMVAGAGIILMSRWMGIGIVGALTIGIAVAIALFALFFVYQQWRIRELAPSYDGSPPTRRET
jgi:hypothetical protein